MKVSALQRSIALPPLYPRGVKVYRLKPHTLHLIVHQHYIHVLSKQENHVFVYWLSSKTIAQP